MFGVRECTTFYRIFTGHQDHGRSKPDRLPDRRDDREKHGSALNAQRGDLVKKTLGMADTGNGMNFLSVNAGGVGAARGSARFTKHVASRRIE